MSFVKRSTVLSARPGRPGQPPAQATPAPAKPQLVPGVRPSPLDGRPCTSTGTASLDQLLAGHAGLPLGTCLLVEEQGTTDFSGILLRYYATEGLVQGHHVHLVGYPPEWRHQLPGLATPDTKAKSPQPPPAPEERMKIAWRYEALSNNASPPGAASKANTSDQPTFCHSFDLSKRLAPSACKGTLHPTPSTCPPTLDQPASSSAPFQAILSHLRTKLASSPPATIHRIVIPGLLLPTLYPPQCALPSEVLPFLHGLRALLRSYPAQLTAMITLPTTLFPRDSGLVRWIELLCDGVIEMIPLPANSGAPPLPSSTSSSASGSGGGAGKAEEQQPQGLLRVHTLPVFHEKGGGGAGASSFRETLAFSLSASRGLDSAIGSTPMAAASSSPTAERLVRISRVAGRYLVFDIDDVVYIRRCHGVCAVLTGTMPQNPTQNLFLGLPVELQAEEAKLLADKGVAYVADELADHLARLSDPAFEPARKTYREHLKQLRRNAQQAFEEEKARIAALHADKRGGKKTKDKKKPAVDAEADPTSPPTTDSIPASTAPSYRLLHYLNSRGYYTTPGLRFGGRLSVYPGDPFRYHAHYLANGYGWDEPVPMLDVVTSGRLGTAVKKGFLFGAEKPAEKETGGEEEGEVRVFCVEWAGM
ncbi:hypothetical protein VTJ49DRAFT_6516 [Mycothermus thermophilus]|uniref:Elongator complex protein 4 n=1 Tax=Humicola insolens TaxID=85995 RepID=A0ABR3VIY8_HUMIN